MTKKQTPNNSLQQPKAGLSKRKQALRPTGIEGVSISGEPEIAQAGIRLIAMVYDGMLILALLFLVGAVLTVFGTLLTMDTGVTSQEAKSLPAWYQNLIMTPSFILTLAGFYGLFWCRAGQTLGMQTWRLKTVSRSGQLLTWKQSMVRILSACVMPSLFGLIGWLLHSSRNGILAGAIFGLLFNYVFCVFNRRSLAVHDMLSDTITLKMPKIHHQSLFKSLRKK